MRGLRSFASSESGRDRPQGQRGSLQPDSWSERSCVRFLLPAVLQFQRHALFPRFKAQKSPDFFIAAVIVNALRIQLRQQRGQRSRPVFLCRCFSLPSLFTGKNEPVAPARQSAAAAIEHAQRMQRHPYPAEGPGQAAIQRIRFAVSLHANHQTPDVFKRHPAVRVPAVIPQRTHAARSQFMHPMYDIPVGAAMKQNNVAKLQFARERQNRYPIFPAADERPHAVPVKANGDRKRSSFHSQPSPFLNWQFLDTRLAI